MSGVFSLDTARQLTTLISRNYPGSGYVFIHTGRLTRVEPLCKVLFSYEPDLTASCNGCADCACRGGYVH